MKAKQEETADYRTRLGELSSENERLKAELAAVRIQLAEAQGRAARMNTVDDSAQVMEARTALSHVVKERDDLAYELGRVEAYRRQIQPIAVRSAPPKG